jgi:hypothetical protein
VLSFFVNQRSVSHVNGTAILQAQFKSFFVYKVETIAVRLSNNSSIFDLFCILIKNHGLTGFFFYEKVRMAHEILGLLQYKGKTNICHYE